MTRHPTLATTAFLLLVFGSACANYDQDTADPFSAALTGDHREPANAQRDTYRHPKETLEFFGLRPDMTVVEIWPSGGWYAEILAPLLREQGKYYAAAYDVDAADQPSYRLRIQKEFENKLAAHPDAYDRVIVTKLALPESNEVCPPESADMLLTFRNTHTFLRADHAEAMFAVFYGALKPGGILGVVQHRARPGTDFETMKRTGYVTEEKVIELARQAGFVLAGRSEVNANPKDNADHPEGVWTLPPSLRLGDQDREKYVSIGESDRMTLKFIKPMPGDAPEIPH